MSDESILEPHPLASLFPPMGRYEYEELKADILRNGLRMPIVLFEERILDGRNRYRLQRSRHSPAFCQL
jgi:hypothetical protein